VSNPATARERLALTLATLNPVRDIVAQRVDAARPPDWCVRRGWVEFLVSLSEDRLRQAEAHGLGHYLTDLRDAPADLRALCDAVNELTALPRLNIEPFALSEPALRSVPQRKREQLSWLLGAVGPMAERAARIVDIGAGAGALTRLAAQGFQRDALGIERNPAQVAAARARAREAEPSLGPAARFVTHDACRDGLELGPNDLAIGLHACGELGDQLVRTAAAIGCDAALISCCLQKISGSLRQPLSEAFAGFGFPRGILGLTNQTAQPVGVEASIEQMLAARKVRYALFRMLRARGEELAPGAEMRGINRRRANAGLREVADAALKLRGLAEATEAELSTHERAAEVEFGQMRRLTLPRSMLARLVEVCITLDRAAYFEEHGLFTTVATLFERRVTPRNLCVFASRDRARLPEPELAERRPQ
jgi:SAM-dependent methyltransferase